MSKFRQFHMSCMLIIINGYLVNTVSGAWRAAQHNVDHRELGAVTQADTQLQLLPRASCWLLAAAPEEHISLPVLTTPASPMQGS